MYDSYYGLDSEPFRLSPDHNMAFEHKRFAKARAYMSYAFMRAEGFVMVTGRPGTGKTTLIGVLKEQLSSGQVMVAKLVCTQLQADELLKLVSYEFGVSRAIRDKGELLQELTSRFKVWDREGRRALLIVDEAQNLSVSALEELRLLTNIETQGRPLLQIFLLGQPELRELILRPELEQVHQRLVAATHLEPLEQSETEAYIRHRLHSAGWRGNPMISKAVYPLVYKFSEGIPRRINLICSRLFLHGAVEQRDRIGIADVRTVVRELQNEGLAAGSRFSDNDFNEVDDFEMEEAAPFVPTPKAHFQPQLKTHSASQTQSPSAALPNNESMPFGTPSSVHVSASSNEASVQAEKQSVSTVPPASELAQSPKMPSPAVDESTSDASVSTPIRRPELKSAISKAPVADLSVEKDGRATEADADDVEHEPKAVARPPVTSDEPVAIEAKSLHASSSQADSAVTHLREGSVLRANTERGLSASEDSRKTTSGSLMITIFILVSVALVAWAAMGFKVPSTFGGI